MFQEIVKNSTVSTPSTTYGCYQSGDVSFLTRNYSQHRIKDYGVSLLAGRDDFNESAYLQQRDRTLKNPVSL